MADRGFGSPGGPENMLDIRLGAQEPEELEGWWEGVMA